MIINTSTNNSTNTIIAANHSQSDTPSSLLLPVTRLKLIPMTERTHQLCVHCAAIGHPIVGDDIYGYSGDGSPHGGFEPSSFTKIGTNDYSMKIEQNMYELVQQKRRRQQQLLLLLQNRNNNDLNHPPSLSTNKFQGNSCLHAKQLQIFHPLTKAPMIFEADSPF